MKVISQRSPAAQERREPGPFSRSLVVMGHRRHGHPSAVEKLPLNFIRKVGGSEVPIQRDRPIQSRLCEARNTSQLARRLYETCIGSLWFGLRLWVYGSRSWYLRPSDTRISGPRPRAGVPSVSSHNQARRGNLRSPGTPVYTPAASPSCTLTPASHAPANRTGHSHRSHHITI